eukprot:UN24985
MEMYYLYYIHINYYPLVGDLHCLACTFHTNIQGSNHGKKLCFSLLNLSTTSFH